MGGFGNQLFQYALYIELLSMGFIVKADTSWYQAGQKKLSLIKDLNLELQYADIHLCNKLADIKETYFSRFKKHYLKKNSHFIEVRDRFNGEIFSLNKKEDIYLEGYWQSYKYFNGNKDIIKKLYFPSDKQKYYRNILENKYGKNKRFVSLHIRRGDYKNNTRIHLLPEKYFLSVFDTYKEIHNDSICLIFSDEITDAKQIMKSRNCFFADWSTSMLDDFYLMASCDDHIISNSSFSYWAAFLGENESAYVYYPSLWFRIIPETSTYFRFPENWIRYKI
jgi:hypothetical protein